MFHYIDAEREELEIEHQAQYDYIAEAHAGLVETCEMLDGEANDRLAEECEAECDAIEARGGPAFGRFRTWTSDDIAF